MGWRIHSWDGASATGEVVSSHFGPWPFTSTSGVQFEVGEDVLVELVGPPDAYRVENVRPARQRQPDGTQDATFDELNARRLPDAHVEEQTADSLTLWVGDCCPQCGPSWLVTFRDMKGLVGLSEHGDLDMPIFRRPSDDERREHALPSDGETRAYCIVTNHGNGPDGPRVFVIARSIEIAPYEAHDAGSGSGSGSGSEPRGLSSR